MGDILRDKFGVEEFRTASPLTDQRYNAEGLTLGKTLPYTLHSDSQLTHLKPYKPRSVYADTLRSQTRSVLTGNELPYLLSYQPSNGEAKAVVANGQGFLTVSYFERDDKSPDYVMHAVIMLEFEGADGAFPDLMEMAKDAASGISKQIERRYKQQIREDMPLETLILSNILSTGFSQS